MTHVAEPPQAPEAESAVLGAFLWAGSLGIDVSAKVCEDVRVAGLEPSDFYRESNGRIFRAILDLLARGVPPDVIVVMDELEASGALEDIGGRSRVHELAALAPSTANAGHFARIIGGKARQRELIRALGPIVEASWNGGADPAETLERLEAARASIMRQGRAPAALEPLDLSDLLAGDPPLVHWLWDGWLAAGDLALVVGDPGVGKSLLTLSLANAVRRGHPLLGDRCTQGTVGVVDLENPASEAHKRLRGVGLTADDHDGLLYFHAPILDLSAPSGIDSLAGAMDQYELDLVIVDSLRRSAPGLDENDSASVSSVLSPMRSLTARSGRTILLIHHARKRIGDNPTDAGQMVRGSGDLVASIDTLLYLRSKESGAFTLEHAKARRGVPHEPILVRIESDEDSIELVSEGPVAVAEDKVESALAKITKSLGDDGGYLERIELALRVGTEARDRTFQRALKLGLQRGLLSTNAEKKVGEKAIYALTPGVQS